MLNQTVLVGRLVENPTIEKKEEKEICRITLAVPRSYKNADGEYETDFITCTLWSGIATNTMEYCHKGDLMGIKGRLQSNIVEDENNGARYYVELIAEKVTFLSSKPNEETSKKDDN